MKLSGFGKIAQQLRALDALTDYLCEFDNLCSTHKGHNSMGDSSSKTRF